MRPCRCHTLLAAAFVISGLAAANAEVNCADEKMCIEAVNRPDGAILFAINKRPGLPLSGKVKLTLKNMKVVEGTNEPFVLEGGVRRKLFRLKPKQPGGPWRWSYEFWWARGDFTATHDDTHKYRLPFKKGETYRVGQGCNGSYSHKGSQKHAVDFTMKIGTPIHAARGGKVVEVREDSKRGGPHPRFKEDSNKVYVQHDDRTLGMYYHLRKDGAVVEIGDKVKAGDLLGYSGNTGWSSGPHLHFEVSRGKKDITGDTSVPITFRTPSGSVKCPKKGRRLRAL